MRYLVKVLCSGKLALMLIAVVLLLSIVGAVYPQEGQLGRAEITQWQTDHPAATRIGAPLGFFAVFKSLFFIITIGLLGLNTSVCTARRFLRGARGWPRTATLGSLALHIGIIATLIGGTISSLKKFDGYVLVTEGQTFAGAQEEYFTQSAARLFDLDQQPRLVFMLKKVVNEPKGTGGGEWPESTLLLRDRGGNPYENTVRVNYPVRTEGFDITQDELGYSPLLQVIDMSIRRPVFQSYVALEGNLEGGKKVHRDFVHVGGSHRVIMTLHGTDPDALNIGFQSSYLSLDVLGEDDEVLSKDIRLKAGESVMFGSFMMKYSDLRRWSSFRVVSDPGYIVVCVGLWLGLAGLVIRYSGELGRWFKEKE